MFSQIKNILILVLLRTEVSFKPWKYLFCWKKNDIFYNDLFLAATAKSLQSCLTLCDPIDGSPPGSPATGILQARTLEWVAISFSNAWKWKVKVKSLCRVRPWATPWTAAFRAPPFMGFSRQEYQSGVPLPSLAYIHIYIYIYTHIYIYIYIHPYI